ncbi:hypothetical protein ACFSM5_06535 [Lacibacterium aquatile]|uniref:Phage tail protein n=1 Tax=Lacibacterium aquatile TaxID=1168082 RepID=A0ABW5DN39_9PROT
MLVVSSREKSIIRHLCSEMAATLPTLYPGRKFKRLQRDNGVLITGLEPIAQLFGALHDGGIVEPSLADDELSFRVEIRYLTRRIDPTYDYFRITLSGLTSLSFEAWLDDGTKGPLEAFGVLSVEPEILQAEEKDGAVEITLHQSQPKTGYSGGLLKLVAAYAVLKDQSGKLVSLDALWDLSDSYWTEWSQRS